MTPANALPMRAEVAPADCWDLTSLFADDGQWEAAFREWEPRLEEYARFRGRLGDGAATLLACIELDIELDRVGERLGTYAFLKHSEDLGEGRYQEMLARYQSAAARAGEAASFIRPELLALPEETLQGYLADPRLAPHRLTLERLLRWRPHTLSPSEERLLAMQAEMAQTANQVFARLNDVDLRFGTVENEHGERVEVSHAGFSALLQSPRRELRRAAFETHYEQYDGHRNVLAAALAGSVHRDVYYARARNFPSALAAALFPDRIPDTVYENLIDSVRRHLPALHRYYEVRRRKMGLKDIHHYDTYVPILADLSVRHPWDEAVETVLAALAPLGDEYLDVLRNGLEGGWCDRYENRGKRSGAFSSGSFDGDPYILMNYREEVLDHVFTLAHEAGHSMHSYYSARHQPYQYYQYTIFVAEVASTFNEQLLARHLMDRADDDRQRAYLVNRQIDAMRATIFRQTMFAEFEKIIHDLAERHEPLSVDRFRLVYGELLDAYFGPRFAIDEALSLECFRIPHFYHAFYVYKYATGLSAAIALADRVAGGGQVELDDYLGFLKGGCAKDPLDLLRDAGVDMERPEPVDAALDHFGRLVDELDRLI